VEHVDHRAQAALELQLRARRRALDAGARRVGWKLGMGDAERIGGHIAVGYLTSDSVLEPGATFDRAGGASLSADAEIALELGRDVAPDGDPDAARAAIAGYGAALEIVDLGDADEGAEAVIAGNVFHRAVAFGGFRAELPPQTTGRLVVNGQVRAAAAAPLDLAGRVCEAARVLRSVGERLRAGDRLITGSVVQVAIGPGDTVVADLGGLGDVGVTIAP
jgi:2-keto-4-pentenoate hydratase